MDDMLFCFLKNKIQADPSPNSSGLCIAKFFNPGNRSQTRPAFRQPLYSDALIHALPQSTILSSSLHESQIMTHSPAKS
jgi:hypothetical protein